MNSGIKQPIVFFGTDDYSLIALQTMIESGIVIKAVVTKPDSAKGRGLKISQPAVKTYAEKHGIKVWQPNKLTDISNEIIALGKPVGVLVSYGKIIPESILNLFYPGIINVHPSLLPKYRGPSPIESVIVNREVKTGVTLIKLVKNMDAGPIYYQTPYALDQTETSPELYNTLFELGTNVLISNLNGIISGVIQPSSQDESSATYCKLLAKADGILDLSTHTPGEAEAKIRAFLKYPKTKVNIGNYGPLTVLQAHVVMTKQSPLDLACKNGAFLSIDKLIAPSGKTMSKDAFLRGYSI